MPYRKRVRRRGRSRYAGSRRPMRRRRKRRGRKLVNYRVSRGGVRL